MTRDLTRRLTAIWCETLSTDEAVGEADFFKAGGDSMGMITLITAVCEEFDVEFDYRPFIEHPTFLNLCACVVAAVEESAHRRLQEAHERAVHQAERAARELLGNRPFRDAPAKPTVALAIALSDTNPTSEVGLGEPLALLNVLKSTLQ